MLQPNNNSEAPFWVVVESSARAGQPGSKKFYAGFNTQGEADDVAAACNHDEIGLFQARQLSHRIAVKYTYSVMAKPAK